MLERDRTMIELGRAFRFGLALGIALLPLMTGCTSIPLEKRDGIRQEMIARADRTLDEFIERYPEVAAELEQSEGYAIGWLESGMAAVARGLGGRALLVDRKTGSRTFLDIGKAGVGVGAGVTEFDQLIIINDRETLKEFQRGHWRFESGSWMASGEDYTLKTKVEESFSRYVIHRKGAAMTATAGVARISVNRDLTDDGVSDVSIPNIGFDRPGEQQEAPPRVWPYRLPFLAQKVVDQGYDLPIPYGVSLTAVDIEQDIVVEDLAVSFDGGERSPYDFVSFENTYVQNQSFQLKADAWLFPFLNVFGLLGNVSGDVSSDVNLDGNTLLDQIGADCDRIIPPLECLLLRDKNLVLPIRVDVNNVTSYGFGAVLAGGWKGWFAALPISVSYTKGKQSITHGRNLTITPRIGRMFNLGNKGNLSLFVGGNHLESDLEIEGVFDVPDTEIQIDYRIKQQNLDPWNVVVGLNWEFSRHIAWSLEYNGFTGSREAWISALSFRLF